MTTFTLSPATLALLDADIRWQLDHNLATRQLGTYRPLVDDPLALAEYAAHQVEVLLQGMLNHALYRKSGSPFAALMALQDGFHASLRPEFLKRFPLTLGALAPFMHAVWNDLRLSMAHGYVLKGTFAEITLEGLSFKVSYAS